MSDINKKIKIENLSSAILAILLMAIYFIKDFPELQAETGNKKIN